MGNSFSKSNMQITILFSLQPNLSALQKLQKHQLRPVEVRTLSGELVETIRGSDIPDYMTLVQKIGNKPEYLGKKIKFVQDSRILSGDKDNGIVGDMADPITLNVMVVKDPVVEWFFERDASTVKHFRMRRHVILKYISMGMPTPFKTIDGTLCSFKFSDEPPLKQLNRQQLARLLFDIVSITSDLKDIMGKNIEWTVINHRELEKNPYHHFRDFASFQHYLNEEVKIQDLLTEWCGSEDHDLCGVEVGTYFSNYRETIGDNNSNSASIIVSKGNGPTGWRKTRPVFDLNIKNRVDVKDS